MIKVNRKRFLHALRLAGSGTEPDASIPVLSSLRITAGDALRIEGTDLDNFTRVEIPYEGDPATFLLPDAAEVGKAIGAAGGATVEIDAQRGGTPVIVRAGRWSAQLVSRPAEDFPTLHDIETETFSATFDDHAVRQIRRIMPAMSIEETRYYLNGICVRRHTDRNWRFAATDGHVLMTVDIPLDDAQGQLPDNIIIPRGWLAIAMGHFAGALSPARLSYGREGEKEAPRIRMEGEDGRGTFALTAQLIDGTYPDFDRVIPAEFAHRVRVDRAAFVQALHALDALCDKRGFGISLSLPGGAVRAALGYANQHKASIDIPAPHQPAADMEILFNTTYLLRVVASLKGKQIEIAINDPASPARFTDPTDPTFLCILMPMKGRSRDER